MDTKLIVLMVMIASPAMAQNTYPLPSYSTQAIQDERVINDMYRDEAITHAESMADEAQLRSLQNSMENDTTSFQLQQEQNAR